MIAAHRTMPSPVTRSGSGSIQLANVAGRTAVVRCRANSPLRLLTPRTASPVARVIAASYGGGLVGGDCLEISVDSGEKTRVLLSTQASTKIYRSAGARCRQQLKVSAGADAMFVSLPDPLVCFAGSDFAQRQEFDLAASASLLMLDWFTSGRAACGERWQMRQYASHSEVNVEGDCVFRDSLALDCRDGDIAEPMRMGRVDCFATAVLIGPALAHHAGELVQSMQRQSISAGEPLLFGASPLPGGAVLRVAGKSTAAVSRFLAEKLSFIVDLLGMDPWRRKW